MHYTAGHGMDLETLAAFRRSFPRPLDRSLVAGRAILERRIMHVQNVAADTALSQEVRDLGGTAIVGIPLCATANRRRRRAEQQRNPAASQTARLSY